MASPSVYSMAGVHLGRLIVAGGPAIAVLSEPRPTVRTVKRMSDEAGSRPLVQLLANGHPCHPANVPHAALNHCPVGTSDRLKYSFAMNSGRRHSDQTKVSRPTYSYSLSDPVHFELRGSTRRRRPRS